jgi:hypothetical protein
MKIYCVFLVILSIDTIIEVKTHKIKEQTETVQTFIQIKHYKNTLNSKIYVQLYLQMMDYCSRVMSQFKNNQKINIWSSSTMVVHLNNPTLHLVPLDNHFKGIKRHPSL